MNRDAFRNLAVAELDSVYRMAFHLARNPDTASDLVQETYLRALKAGERFELRDGGLRPWLFKILHNVFYTQVGRERRMPTLVEDLSQEVAPPDFAPDAGWDMQSLDWEQVDERLKHAIDDLSDHYREVLLLWAIEGLKYREIADVLDVPLGTVMSRLHRARGVLSEKLSDLAAEHGIGVAPDVARRQASE